jgi:hypothetical protein
MSSTSATSATDTLPCETCSGITDVILLTATDKYYFLNSVSCRNGSCGDAIRWIKQPPHSFKEQPINMQSISACTETQKRSDIYMQILGMIRQNWVLNAIYKSCVWTLGKNGRM